MVSIAEYLSTSYRPDCDYIDGVVLERNLGEWDHSRLQMRVAAYLFNRQSEWGIWVVPEQRVQVSPARFRIPDVTVVKGAEPDEPILTHPPFLCIEVLSKDDTLRQTRERVDDYLRFGVPHVWVLDPRAQKGYNFTPEGMQELTEGVLTTSDPEVAVPLRDLFNG